MQKAAGSSLARRAEGASRARRASRLLARKNSRSGVVLVDQVIAHTQEAGGKGFSGATGK